MTEEFRPDRNLIIRSENTIDNLTYNAYLARAGFSNNFPQLLMRLNDVLPPQRLDRLTLELHPGKTPQIDTYIRHRGGYRFFVDAIPEGRRVELSLFGSGSHFHLDDIKEFSKNIFSDKLIYLYSPSNGDLLRRIEDFNQDIQTVDSDSLRAWFENRPARQTSPIKEGGFFVARPYELSPKVLVPNQKNPLFNLQLWHMHYAPDMIGCEISTFLDDREPAFFYSGSPQEAEKVMEELAKLFNKPNGYPYQPVEE